MWVDYAYQCLRSYIALCISIIFTARAARFVFSKAVILMIAYILACIYLLCTNTVCVCVCFQDDRNVKHVLLSSEEERPWGTQGWDNRTFYQ